MIDLVAQEDLERFRDLVSGRFGLAFDPAKLDQLARVLLDRLKETGSRRPEAYLDLLASPGAAGPEFGVLAERLTVAETYFFRHPDQFRAFLEVALPECRRLQGARRRLRILSAGCSSGEEPYTLAMLARDQLGALAEESVEIIGININSALLQRAREGRYSEWALRGTPEVFRSRHFRQEGRDYLLEEAIRRMVVFEERNLMSVDPAYWRPGAFDVIFCRNVIMYFTPRAMSDVVERFVEALTPGGFLFLGPAETLRGLSQSFHLRHSHDTFYYQAKAPKERAERTLPTPVLPPPCAPSAPTPDTSWLETIARASARIEVLTSSPRPGPEVAPAAGPTPAVDLRQAMDLMRQERFQEAVGVLRALPPEAEQDADAQLLLAVLLAQDGAFGEAESLCATVLALDDLNAGAHYLAALCRDAAGDSEGAAEHDRAAAYLDPGFAMPHLHLGLMARRQGLKEVASRELGLAQGLLQREEASRILLFGGGFGREALVQLCRASGGVP